MAGQWPDHAEQVASIAGGVLDLTEHLSGVPERSEGPSEAMGADAVVLDDDYSMALVALTAQALSAVSRAHRETQVACQELERTRRLLADYRSEIENCEAARDNALMAASEAAERAHRACEERDTAERHAAEMACDLDQARADASAATARADDTERELTQYREGKALRVRLRGRRVRLAGPASGSRDGEGSK
ncbi:hypothetical protein DRW03_06310 [Corallococcus sp. H22C18031201]|nr:hypothetical protein DRW03_06310 [Corallococcus sp. H22C18031201]